MRFLFALLALFALSPAKAADDLPAMNAVSKAWGRWAETSSKDDPSSAELLAASSLKHFEFLRDAALYASADQVRRLPATDRLFVYYLRASKKEAELKALDGKGLARLCLTGAICGVSEPEPGGSLPELTHVTVIGDHALGEFAPPNEIQYQFGPEFAREDGRWKLMYESLVPDTSGWLELRFREAGADSKQGLLNAVAELLEPGAQAPSPALLDRPLEDDAAQRTRLNEAWPDYARTYKQRFEALRKKAADGDPLAQFVVGSMEYSGAQPDWTPKDEAAGLAMLERSSEGGNTRAAWAAVEILLSDDAETTDETRKRALPHVRRAAESGNAQAMVTLAGYYFNGAASLQRDCRQAAEWQARAEEAGLAAGRNEVIWTYATCPIPEQRDPARALQLAQHLIEKKDKLERYELDTIAATFAANADFPRAIEYQELAVSKLTKEDPDGTRKGMQARLKQYRKGRDWVQDFNSLELKDGY